MRFYLTAAIIASLLGLAPRARAAGAAEPAGAPKLQPVWQAHLGDFSETAYDAAVEDLFRQFEAASGHKIAPGAKGRVGLKVYTDSGPGMATPIPLVQAVIAALERRGYQSSNIFLVGLNQLRMRMTGYLPSLVTGRSPFSGHPIFILESGKYYNTKWFYDSPLPQRFDPVFMRHQTEDVPDESTTEQDRKSFLATPLFLDADFWIDLPVYTDHPTIGVNGALVNATLWNASNTARFFRSTANAPAAVAEMSAIPELRDTWLFTIASLQHYQFIGGPYFNSLYTVSEPLLWLSRDPVMLDALMLQRINDWRRRSGFEPISRDIRTLQFAQMLGVGSTDTKDVKIINVN